MAPLIPGHFSALLQIYSSDMSFIFQTRPATHTCLFLTVHCLVSMFCPPLILRYNSNRIVDL